MLLVHLSRKLLIYLTGRIQAWARTCCQNTKQLVSTSVKRILALGGHDERAWQSSEWCPNCPREQRWRGQIKGPPQGSCERRQTDPFPPHVHIVTCLVCCCLVNAWVIPCASLRWFLNSISRGFHCTLFFLHLVLIFYEILPCNIISFKHYIDSENSQKSSNFNNCFWNTEKQKNNNAVNVLSFAL